MLALERSLQNATVTPVQPHERYLAPANEFIDVQFADRAIHALRELVRIQTGKRTLDLEDGDGDDGGGDDATGSGDEGASLMSPRPWFLGLGFHMPHEPYVFPSEFWDLYSYEDPRAPRLPYPPHPQTPRDAPPYDVGDVQSPFALLFDTVSAGKGAASPWADEHYCRNASARALSAGGQASGEPPATALVGRDRGGKSVAMGGDLAPTCSVDAIATAIRHWRRRLIRKRPSNWPEEAPWPPRRRPMPYAQQQELLRGYSAAVSFMDSQLGRVLEALDEAGAAGSTVVVFTGDHGFSIGDHGQWGKRSLFENDCRVPLIVADPSRPRGHGSRSSALVELVDVLPTLAHLAGINEAAISGPPLSGSSLAHLLEPEPPEPPESEPPERTPRTAGAVSAGDDAARRQQRQQKQQKQQQTQQTQRQGRRQRQHYAHRAAAVTQFVRCPMTASRKVDFREGKSSAIDHGCLRSHRGWLWYDVHELVIMGYSLRTERWRYTAWLLWDTNSTNPIWRYPPLGELIFDHRGDAANQSTGPGGFDAFEGESLARHPATGPLRWALFLSLKALVQGDANHELGGGRRLGLAGLAAKGLAGPWGVGPCRTEGGNPCLAAPEAGAGDGAAGGAGGSAAAPGGPLPRWLSAHLDRHGLLPPSHAEAAEKARRQKAQASETGAEARERYESAGFQAWPAPLGAAEALMASLEPFLLPGDTVEAARFADLVLGGGGEASREAGGGDGAASVTAKAAHRALQLKAGTPRDRAWAPFVVAAAVPKVTLRGETGAALCLAPADSPVAAEALAAAARRSGSAAQRLGSARGGGNGDGEDVDLWAEGEQFLSLGLLHIPSQVWPEKPRLTDEHPRGAARGAAATAPPPGLPDVATGEERWAWKPTAETAVRLKARGLGRFKPAPWAAPRAG